MNTELLRRISLRYLDVDAMLQSDDFLAEKSSDDLFELYNQMIELDETMLMNFCGIDAADCAQYAASICYDGLRTDEVWVIEAVSEEAKIKLTFRRQE